MTVEDPAQTGGADGSVLASRRARAALLAVAAGIVGVVVVTVLTMWTFRGVPGQTEMVVIDESMPVTANEDAVLARLNERSEVAWQGELVSGGQLARLGRAPELAIDVEDAARSRVAITNVRNSASVGKNGHLLVLGPSFRPQVEDLVREDPRVFADGSVERERRTYRLGGWITYYSPAGADEDRSQDVEDLLSEVARCPYDADPCPGGDS